jgi:hypothetical protein
MSGGRDASSSTGKTKADRAVWASGLTALAVRESVKMATETEMGTRYEYKTVDVPGRYASRAIKRRTRKGWEVVSMVNGGGSAVFRFADAGDRVVIHMRRPVRGRAAKQPKVPGPSSHRTERAFGFVWRAIRWFVITMWRAVVRAWAEAEPHVGDWVAMWREKRRD